MNTTNKQSTLDIYCEQIGQAGGTIHGAVEAFKGMEQPQQDRICSAMMAAMDSKRLLDPENYLLFVRARIAHIKFSTPRTA